MHNYKAKTIWKSEGGGGIDDLRIHLQIHGRISYHRSPEINNTLIDSFHFINEVCTK